MKCCLCKWAVEDQVGSCGLVTEFPHISRQRHRFSHCHIECGWKESFKKVKCLFFKNDECVIYLLTVLCVQLTSVPVFQPISPQYLMSEAS